VDTIAPGSDQNFTSSFNTEGLAAGEYTANITIHSNEFGNPELNIPVHLTVNSTVGITEFSNDIEWNVYPNPSKGEFMLRGFSQNQQEIELIIFNSLGVQVHQKTISVYKKFFIPFDLNNLSDGIYMIHVNGEGVSGASKVVLQR